MPGRLSMGLPQLRPLFLNDGPRSKGEPVGRRFVDEVEPAFHNALDVAAILIGGAFSAEDKGDVRALPIDVLQIGRAQQRVGRATILVTDQKSPSAVAIVDSRAGARIARISKMAKREPARDIRDPTDIGGH